MEDKKGSYMEKLLKIVNENPEAKNMTWEEIKEKYIDNLDLSYKEVKQLKKTIMETNKNAILDYPVSSILSNIADLDLQFTQVGKQSFIIKTKDGTLKIKSTIDENAEESVTFYCKYRIPVYLFTLQVSRKQRTNKPEIPVSLIRDKFGNYVAENIEEIYKSLRTYLYEFESDSQYFKEFGSLKLIEKGQVHREKKKGKYYKIYLANAGTLALRTLNKIDREIINRAGEDDPLSLEEIKRINAEQYDEDTKELKSVDLPINFQEIPIGFSENKWTRSTKACWSLFHKYNTILEDRRETYPVKIKTILKSDLGLSNKWIENENIVELAKILDKTFNELEEKARITWNVSEDSIEKLQHNKIFNSLTQDKIKEEGLKSIPEYFKRIRELDIEEIPGKLFSKNSPDSTISFLDLKIKFRRIVE